MILRKALRVSNPLGLHARPAALFVQTAGKFKCSVKVSRGEVEVNGKSMMGLMMLAAEQGAELLISVEGEDASQALREIEELFRRRFGE